MKKVKGFKKVEMQLTKEQCDIIGSTGNIRINAVAGSGKTTTIIEYARTRPANSKILYLAFNKSVKIEAVKKFAEKGLTNVKVETAHSLAYKHVVSGSHYRVKTSGYKASEIADLLHLKGNGEKHGEYIVANHINRFISCYCNSDKENPEDINYLETITDKKARTFASVFFPYILKQSQALLDKMERGTIEVTHDFYLKKFQLSNPMLLFDYILFDEGQDASPAMLDVFFRQRTTKVIVGDTHQQIYSWRFAVNSLEKADFSTYHLSTSFRFPQDIANLAMNVLAYKNYTGGYDPIPITGCGAQPGGKTKAVLARTNLGLLLKAIEYVTENALVQHIYFEGNINSYTYADDGASLYDVLNLYNGKFHLIRDRLVKSMKDLCELEDYIDKTEDVQLGMMVKIVKEYGNRIPDILRSIKAKHVENEEKQKAEMIFSTVHRCKGMEYDSVELVNDFISNHKLEKLKEEQKQEISLSKINEEINLLYVAITRTRNTLQVPEQLLPADFPASSLIEVIKPPPVILKDVTAVAYLEERNRNKNGAERSYNVRELRSANRGAYQPWTAELDEQLTKMFCDGVSIKDMGKYFNRTSGSIMSRIKKLQLYELYG